MDSGLQLVLSGAAPDQNTIFTRLFWSQSAPSCMSTHPIFPSCIVKTGLCGFNKVIKQSVFATFAL